MKFASWCSGIEAASVAWTPLGWQCVSVSEIDPFACAVLREHYPDVPNLGDMTTVLENTMTTTVMKWIGRRIEEVEHA